jgi:hypothetical protein
MCFNPSPERRVPSPNRYMVFARFCFCKNNKRTIIIITGLNVLGLLFQYTHLHSESEVLLTCVSGGGGADAAPRSVCLHSTDIRS